MSSEIQKVHLRTKGILPVQKLRVLANAGIISHADGYPLQDDQFQPNSIDLRLGEKAYRVRCSFLPEDESVDQKLEKLSQYDFSITDGAILEPNCVYIIPLLEELHLPSHISPQKTLFNGNENGVDYQIVSGEHLSAKANPKSTTGR
nr:2'-deoxycytidine 5'-triphosphate deaminase [Fodinibius sp.]NIV14863.1 2'-deoxycytidine 5'-triphosphate deaminase [Fodinibius sp.]NIY25513.1 2'-deoxycytidine 5'-triphosphate deaminase [Fodinibius sp.]